MKVIDPKTYIFRNSTTLPGTIEQLSDYLGKEKTEVAEQIINENVGKSRQLLSKAERDILDEIKQSSEEPDVKCCMVDNAMRYMCATHYQQETGKYDKERFTRIPDWEYEIPKPIDDLYLKVYNSRRFTQEHNQIEGTYADYVPVEEDDYTVSEEQIKASEKERDKIISEIPVNDKSGMYLAFKKFSEKGVWDIRNQSVELNNGTLTETGWKQLHAAAEIYRNKRFETTRYIFIDRETGMVKDQLAISSRLPNVSAVSEDNEKTLKQVLLRAQETNSLVAMVHNHPSGNTAQSIEDEVVTKKISNFFTRNDGKEFFAGHIILDHQDFNLFTPDKGWHKEERMKRSPNKLENEDKREWEEKYIGSRAEFKKVALGEVARMINDNENYSDDFIPVAFADSQLKISGIKLFHKSVFAKDPEFIKGEFELAGKEAGATRAFPVFTTHFLSRINENGRNKLAEKLKRCIEHNSFCDACLGRNVITEKFGIKPGREYFTEENVRENLKPEVHATWGIKDQEIDESMFHEMTEEDLADNINNVAEDDLDYGTEPAERQNLNIDEWAEKYQSDVFNDTSLQWENVRSRPEEGYSFEGILNINDTHIEKRTLLGGKTELVIGNSFESLREKYGENWRAEAEKNGELTVFDNDQLPEEKAYKDGVFNHFQTTKSDSFICDKLKLKPRDEIIAVQNLFRDTDSIELYSQSVEDYEKNLVLEHVKREGAAGLYQDGSISEAVEKFSRRKEYFEKSLKENHSLEILMNEHAPSDTWEKQTMDLERQEQNILLELREKYHSELFNKDAKLDWKINPIEPVLEGTLTGDLDIGNVHIQRTDGWNNKRGFVVIGNTVEGLKEKYGEHFEAEDRAPHWVGESAKNGERIVIDPNGTERSQRFYEPGNHIKNHFQNNEIDAFICDKYNLKSNTELKEVIKLCRDKDEREKAFQNFPEKKELFNKMIAENPSLANYKEENDKKVQLSQEDKDIYNVLTSKINNDPEASWLLPKFSRAKIYDPSEFNLPDDGKLHVLVEYSDVPEESVIKKELEKLGNVRDPKTEKEISWDPVSTKHTGTIENYFDAISSLKVGNKEVTPEELNVSADEIIENNGIHIVNNKLDQHVEVEEPEITVETETVISQENENIEKEETPEKTKEELEKESAVENIVSLFDSYTKDDYTDKKAQVEEIINSYTDSISEKQQAPLEVENLMDENSVENEQTVEEKRLVVRENAEDFINALPENVQNNVRENIESLRGRALDVYTYTNPRTDEKESYLVCEKPNGTYSSHLITEKGLEWGNYDLSSRWDAQKNSMKRATGMDFNNIEVIEKGVFETREKGKDSKNDLKLKYHLNSLIIDDEYRKADKAKIEKREAKQEEKAAKKEAKVKKLQMRGLIKEVEREAGKDFIENMPKDLRVEIKQTLVNLKETPRDVFTYRNPQTNEKETYLVCERRDGSYTSRRVGDKSLMWGKTDFPSRWDAAKDAMKRATGRNNLDYICLKEGKKSALELENIKLRNLELENIKLRKKVEDLTDKNKALNNLLYSSCEISVNGKTRTCEKGLFEGFKNSVSTLDKVSKEYAAYRQNTIFPKTQSAKQNQGNCVEMD